MNDVKKIIKIQSRDNSDLIVFVDKIECVLEKENGCEIHLDNGKYITSKVKMKDVENPIDEVLKGGNEKWVDVNERLPEKNERVLVYLKKEACAYTRIDTDRRMDNGRWIRWGNNVTHWMALPEPPTEKGGDE